MVMDIHIGNIYFVVKRLRAFTILDKSEKYIKSTIWFYYYYCYDYYYYYKTVINMDWF